MSFPAVGGLVRRHILVVCVLVLPALGGCSPRVRCLKWDASEGACPAAELAERTFREVDATCDDVDGDAEFDGDSCCYEVSDADDCVP